MCVYIRPRDSSDVSTLRNIRELMHGTGWEHYYKNNETKKKVFNFATFLLM